MSRVGSQPITIPKGVEVKLDGQNVTAKGSKGELSWELPYGIVGEVSGDSVEIRRENDHKTTRALHGTSRSLVANMIEGVLNGFQKELEISGVGFRAQLQGKKLVIQAGFSHPIEFDKPEGLDVTVPKDTTIVVSGADKQLVGLFSSKIRNSYPAEPYKGKGIKYKGEQIRRKAGKTVA